MATGKVQKPSNGSNLDFEAQLWAAAEQAVPTPHYEKPEYNGARSEGLCLGLIFLKYISDAFEEKREQLRKPEVRMKKEDALPLLHSSFCLQTSPVLPSEARWHTIKARAKSPEIGKVANPPFNMSDWSRGGEMRQDVRWKFGMPPVNNANYAWIQHFIRHLSPVGVAGFVMANGSMSTQTGSKSYN